MAQAASQHQLKDSRHLIKLCQLTDKECKKFMGVAANTISHTLIKNNLKIF